MNIFEKFTRRREIEEYAAEHEIGFDQAVVELVNRALSTPEPEPTLDDKLHALHADIQMVTDHVGRRLDKNDDIAISVMDLSCLLSVLVSIMRHEIRRGLE